MLKIQRSLSKITRTKSIKEPKDEKSTSHQPSLRGLFTRRKNSVLVSDANKETNPQKPENATKTQSNKGLSAPSKLPPSRLDHNKVRGKYERVCLPSDSEEDSEEEVEENSEDDGDSFVITRDLDKHRNSPLLPQQDQKPEKDLECQSRSLEQDMNQETTDKPYVQEAPKSLSQTSSSKSIESMVNLSSGSSSSNTTPRMEEEGIKDETNWLHNQSPVADSPPYYPFYYQMPPTPTSPYNMMMVDPIYYQQQLFYQQQQQQFLYQQQQHRQPYKKPQNSMKLTSTDLRRKAEMIRYGSITPRTAIIVV
ncbi:uncharacterized protein B0P05DRAFT_590003 [Gilbertella persicaria]|uniref:uncharacterized protein n=1 Tax=Gilbertella persicaria TaxID=101096 RepID=UPI00221F28D1|nr:uncharacterized protein B0P05DRAFT_590003 [Gilbertella persicaria]KAI8064799.1 hypothetical protein B0P05DRAFT_590003 [Gilbertella persicaria]